MSQNLEQILQPIIRGKAESNYPSVCLVRLVSHSGAQSICTGTLISPNLVLCAAHCVDAPRIYSAVCEFKDERVAARRWFWNRKFSQDKIERNTTEFARLKSVGSDFTILQLDRPIVDIKPSPMMPFSVFHDLMNKGEIKDLTAVGFGRYSKSELTDIYAGVNKRSASFRTFSIPKGTQTIKVYPHRKVQGEPVSIGVGDSGGPYFAQYQGVNYIVATVSTVTYDLNGDAAFATALNVDAPIAFFEGSVLNEFSQNVGPSGYNYVSPRKSKIDERNLKDLAVDENLCIDEYCIQASPILFGSLALAPLFIYAIIGLRLKDMK